MRSDCNHILKANSRYWRKIPGSGRASDFLCAVTIGSLFMLNEESVNRKDVAGFLLGLGIGLVVGIVFKAEPEDPPPHLRVADGGKVPRRNFRPERDNAVAKAAAAY
jgi:hypothetical protein